MSYVLIYLALGLGTFGVAAGQNPTDNKCWWAFVLSLLFWPIQMIGNLIGVMAS